MPDIKALKYAILPAFLYISSAVQAQVTLPDMVLVAGGTYQMGSTTGEKNEKPVHAVTLRSFYIGKYEVTQKLWAQVMGDTPSRHRNCPDCPVESVTQEQVVQFIVRLNQKTEHQYRLPTEAEWEYAALGGAQTRGYRYPGSNDLAEVAWYRPNAGDTTHPVGLRKPNELGLYDMAGNAWELCSDYYDPGYYAVSPATDPRNDKPAAFRLLRGGSWRSADNRCYSKARNRNVYDHYHFGNGGFRLVLDK